MKGILVLYDADKKEIERLALVKAPFKQGLINNKSEEMFGESEPCIIQSTTCRNQLGLDMINYVKLMEFAEIKKMFSVKAVNEFSTQLDFPSSAKYYSFE